MRRSIGATLLTATVLTAVAAGAAAQVSDVTDPIRSSDGIRYACTGVGSDSRQDPRWRSFAAKLVFAADNGGFLSQVGTRIADSQGRTVFEVQECGPWLLLDLPAGSYEAAATARDGQGRPYERRFAVTAGAGGQSETIVRFSEIPG